MKDNALKETLEYMEERVGGRIPFVQALTASKNPAAKALVAALGKEENDQKSVFEVAMTIKRDPMELQKAFAEGLQLQNVVESANRMFEALPDVMQATIDVAKAHSKDGHGDRKMLLEMAGLLKKDGGLQISLNQNFQSMLPANNPASGTHDLLHSNPFADEPIDVEPEEPNDG